MESIKCRNTSRILTTHSRIHEKEQNLHLKDIKEAKVLSRKLTDKSPELPYKSRTGEIKFTLKWGQRKLLISEIEFLSDNLTREEKCTVVYAGAAHGTHIEYLSNLFPECKFILIDPSKFTISESNRISIRNEYFTNRTAREFMGKNVYFISDIRSYGFTNIGIEELELRIKSDMEDQERWHKIMQPRKSLLKFRLPWYEETLEYLNGDVYIQAWSGGTSTETRLVPTKGSKTWNNKKYANQMYYHNTVSRMLWYPHSVVNHEGLDHCYDCSTEIYVLGKYLEFRYGEKLKNQSSIISHMSMEISRELGERTLEDPQPPPFAPN